MTKILEEIEDDQLDKLHRLILSGVYLNNSDLEPYIAEFEHLDVRPLLKRVFDINENSVIDKPAIDKGLLGLLNRIGRCRKEARFRRRIEEQSGQKKRYMVLAEGDSWFEFPLCITEILDWLGKDDEFMVKSIASGGDWIANMIYERKYIEELSQYQPEAFLISGGGNDLTAEGRLARLVNKKTVADQSATIHPIDEDVLREHYSYLKNGAEVTGWILTGLNYLNRDFYSLLNTFRFQYLSLFHRIFNKTDKFKNMRAITQGYDFAVPDRRRDTLHKCFMRSNQWLSMPLRDKGLLGKDLQHSIVAAMIHEFNQMLIEVGQEYDKVYHIDVRGFIPESGWKDELHAKSKYYRVIADCYMKTITAEIPSKVEKVVGFEDRSRQAAYRKR